MKRILSRSLVLSLCLILSLPTVADAFLGRAAKPEPLSDTSMNWDDAKAWCKRQGGRLPLINDATSLTWDQIIGPKTALIDGFGQINTGPEGQNWRDHWTTPWPSGLPSSDYWTGTEDADRPGRSWIVNGLDGIVIVSFDCQSYSYRVVCVP